MLQEVRMVQLTATLAPFFSSVVLTRSRRRAEGSGPGVFCSTYHTLAPEAGGRPPPAPVALLDTNMKVTQVFPGAFAKNDCFSMLARLTSVNASSLAWVPVFDGCNKQSCSDKSTW